jgi:cytochrome c oxidase subunit 2
MTDTAREYRHLFDIYVPIGVGVFLVIFGFVGYALIRYRWRPGRVPRGKAERSKLELAYAVALACIVPVLLYFTFTTEARVDRLPKHPGLRVVVTGAQWNWRFFYPKYGVTEFSGTSRPGTLYVPSNTQILFLVRSVDVIHSFWIPQMRMKKDAFPGATNKVGMVFGRPGVIESGTCAEFCGLHHADMRFNVRVLTPAAFDAWARSRQKAGRG